MIGMMLNCPTTLIISFASQHLLFPQMLLAYIDPGTGSFILQMIMAALLAGGYTIRLKVKRFFEKLFFSRRDMTRRKNN